LGISKSKILAVVAATIISSGLLLGINFGNVQQASAQGVFDCTHVFLPTDPVQVTIDEIKNDMFKTVVVEHETLDCIDQNGKPLVRDISIIITQKEKPGGFEMSSTIMVLTCDTFLNPIDDDPNTNDPGGSTKPICTMETITSSAIADTNCVPEQGDSYIKTAGETFDFTLNNNQMTGTKTVILQKGTLGCNQDIDGVGAGGEVTIYHEVFNMIEMFDLTNTLRQDTIICVKDYIHGEIDQCQDFPDVSPIPST